MIHQASPWHWDIGLYFILAGLASGIALVCWWIRPRDEAAADRFEWLAGLVSMAVIAICSFILVRDLHQPARFHLMITEFSNLGSVMSVGAKLIALKMGLLALYLFLLYRRRQAHATGDREEPDAITRAFYRGTPALLGVTSVGVAIYPAFLLSRTWVAPLTQSPGSGVLFLSTAMVMGAAVAAILACVVPSIDDEPFRLRVGRTLVFLLAVQSVGLVLEGLALHGSEPALALALEQVLVGGASRVFWWIVVAAGLAVPILGLTAMPKNRPLMAVSAASALVGAGALRYLFFAVA